VVVLGAGNTAIDVATAARRLGAGSVTIAYRRSESLIPAFAYEYELAKSDGIRFEWLAQPIRIVGDGKRACGVEFLRTELEDTRARAGCVKTVPGTNFILPADMVVKALGQEALVEWTSALPDLRCEHGSIVVDRTTGATSIPRLFAGGDCLRNGGEIVDAVRDGKLAARGIHAALAAL
jgi:glutamate synthase (NADPH/NADH) small chain